ncbi:hypothetical protein MHZ92_07865 [Sporosarcina sp. ACRSL]|uniref:hypothetical protein n=1 Tax=Sporosarcina sp. ACRSL TaxID=2918215 RepID=UPI001EF4D4B7|nr:hypothetical protein [Sporosarcina sp. ACRSL]MCG7344044.1 hypothetical protein [Sporosarcina sp. ACRSL]
MSKEDVVANLDYTAPRVYELDRLKEEYRIFELKDPLKFGLYGYYERTYPLPIYFNAILALIIFAIPLWCVFVFQGFFSKILIFAITVTIFYYISKPFKFIFKKIDFSSRKALITINYESACKEFDEQSTQLAGPIIDLLDDLRENSVVPENYWHTDAMRKITRYFANHRAETLKEAINLYEQEAREDQRHKEVQLAFKQREEELKKQLNQQRELLEKQERKLQQVSDRLYD